MKSTKELQCYSKYFRISMKSAKELQCYSKIF